MAPHSLHMALTFNYTTSMINSNLQMVLNVKDMTLMTPPSPATRLEI